MDFENLEEILRFAIGKEEEAVAFYEEVSALEFHPGIRKTFKDFAGEERKHRALLEGMLRGGSQLSGYEFRWIPNLKRSEYLVDQKYLPGMPYADILRLAMKREEKALDLYRDLQEKTENREFKEVFRMLAQEEAGHKLAIETIYDDYMRERGD